TAQPLDRPVTKMLKRVVSGLTSSQIATPVTALGLESGLLTGIGSAAMVTEFLIFSQSLGSSSFLMASWTLGSTWSWCTVSLSRVTSSKSGMNAWGSAVLLMT